MKTTLKQVINDFKEQENLDHKKADNSYLELVKFFPLQSLKTQKQHQSALNLAHKLMEFLYQKPDKGVEIYLTTLVEFIEIYENNLYGMPKVNGNEMLAYIMKLHGYTQADIAQCLGGQGNVSKILKGERQLNLRQIRELSQKFNISPLLFI